MRQYKNGFIVLESHSERRLLVYMDARKISLYDKERSEYINFYHEEKLNGLAFENEIYYPFDNMEVLKDYPFIENLLINQSNIENLEGLKYVNNLKGLFIDENTAKIDFDLLKKSLETLAFTWHKKVYNLPNLNSLQILHIEKDNEEVLFPSTIKELELWKSKRSNLNFLEGLTSLKRIELFSNNKLINIDGLQYGNNIEELDIERCKNITNYKPVLELKKLKKLRISKYSKEMKSKLVELKTKISKEVEIIIYPSL